MKKNYIIFLCTLFILFLGIVYNPITINADSGFDSSWDSGSSSSDWDSSSDFDSSSSGGYVGTGNIAMFFIFVISLIILYFIYYIAVNKFNAKNVGKPLFIIFLIISFFTVGISFAIMIIFITISIKSSANKTNKNMNYSMPHLTEQQILELDANLNIEEFNQIVFNTYKDIQIAWMNFDLDTIKNLVSDEIYNMYSMQLDTLKIKGQKNIMQEIEYINNYISNITFENNVETINTILTVECFDYLVNQNNKVVRGNKKQKLIYTYQLTFTKYTTDKKITHCPNCGAKIDINSTGVCEYCNSTIINQETKWIMTKKQMLNQRRK